MSWYGYLEVFHSPLDFEITRVDCIINKAELGLNHSVFAFAISISVDSISAVSRQEAHGSIIKFCPTEHRPIMRKKLLKADPRTTTVRQSAIGR